MSIILTQQDREYLAAAYDLETVERQLFKLFGQVSIEAVEFLRVKVVTGKINGGVYYTTPFNDEPECGCVKGWIGNYLDPSFALQHPEQYQFLGSSDVITIFQEADIDMVVDFQSEEEMFVGVLREGDTPETKIESALLLEMIDTHLASRKEQIHGTSL